MGILLFLLFVYLTAKCESDAKVSYSIQISFGMCRNLNDGRLFYVFYAYIHFFLFVYKAVLMTALISFNGMLKVESLQKISFN